MKVATFNINNINKRLDNLLAWLAKAEPDVVSLQELKAEQGAFPVNALRSLGYEAVWLGERSWNGVAILSRNQVPVVTRTSLPGNPAGHNNEDQQARYIEAAVQGVLITSIYLPNGNPQPGPKFNYKLAWFERLIAHASELMASGAPVVLAGDYNVVPTPQDIYPTRSFDSPWHLGKIGGCHTLRSLKSGAHAEGIRVTSRSKAASGLTALVWRSQWESSHDPSLKEKLLVKCRPRAGRRTYAKDGQLHLNSCPQLHDGVGCGGWI